MCKSHSISNSKLWTKMRNHPAYMVFFDFQNENFFPVLYYIRLYAPAIVLIISLMAFCGL